MRTIKFRAWEKPGIVLSNTQGTQEFKGRMWDYEHIKDNPLCRLNEDTENIFMQFTGLHDKNGKEIFEGDIINGEDCAWKVVWDDICWRIYRKTNEHEILLPKASWVSSPLSFLFCEDAEIIGNIYENPELLK